MSEVEDITGHDITTRVNQHGWDLNRAISQPKLDKSNSYDYNGKTYTLQELLQFSRVKGLTTKKLSTRIREYNWDIERALTQPLNVKIQPCGVGERIYEYNGKMYNSYELTQISPISGLKISDITCRINKHGWTVERAITTPKKKMNILFEYEGKQYNSRELAEIAIDPNMTHNDVTDRNRAGWTAWEIVNIPLGMTRKKFYKTQE